jgi:quercetin dioxygenase-like cupin family protein
MELKEYREIQGRLIDNEAARGINARVVIGKADGAPNFCMRVFEIAPGGHTPRHAHAWEHEMFVHAGAGEVFGNGRWQPLQAGQAVFNPGNEEHQMRNNGRELLIVVCLVPGGAPEL